MKLVLKFKKPKMLMGLKVHQDGFKSIDYQEWRSAVLKHNRTRDEITQAMTHTQRHVNNV